jgi:uncharacterized protein
MTMLTVPAGDLLGSPGKERRFSGTKPVNLRFGDATVDGPMSVTGVAHGQLDSVRADFEVSASAHFICTRCLDEWDETVSTSVEQFFRKAPDEDGYAIVDGVIDVAGPAQDELALALPAAPLCRADCKGLCPTCGSDLNNDPCDGHGEDSESPFAALKDLFDS